MKSKLKLRGIEESGILHRQEIYNYYYLRYFNLFMNHWKIKGLTDEENNYIFRRFWMDGKVACYKVKNTETEELPYGLLVFTPYAPIKFNLYDYPLEVTLINKRGIKGIPATPQRVDKDVVLGYSQHSKSPVFRQVEFFIKRIVDIEMVLRMNLKVQKMPWIVGVTPENQRKMRELWNKLEEDDASLFVDIEDAQNLKALVSGANYNLDKLYQLKQAYENELRGFIGINNVGVMEKHEHMIQDEIAVANGATNYSSDCFRDVIEQFIQRIKYVFGASLELEENFVEGINITKDNEEQEYDEGGEKDA